MFQVYIELNEWLKYLMLIPLLVGIIKYRELNLPLKILLYYVIFDIVTTLINEFLWARNINNLYVFNLFKVVEFFIITYVFQLIIKNKRIDYLIKTAYFVYGIVILYTFLYYQAFDEYANHLNLIESFLFIVFASSYLFYLIKNEKDILKDPFAWFSSAVLMYFITSFLIYASFHKLAKLDKTVFMQVWTVKNLFMYLYFILIAVAFYKQAKLSSSKNTEIVEK